MMDAFGFQVTGMVLVAILGVASIHLVTAARRRLRRMTAVAEAISSTLRRDGRDEAVDELLEAVRRMLKADVAWLALVPRDSSTPLVAERTPTDAIQLRPTNLTRRERDLLDLVGRKRGVLQSGRPSSAHLRAVLEERRLSHGMVASVLRDRDAVALLLVGRAGGRRFGANERDLFGLVSEHAGAVLENDRLERSLREVLNLKEELRHRADHDVLTGLPNRALFATRVDRALQRDDAAARLAVLFLDLDDFKDVNDTLGHEAGDELLAGVGQRVARAIRPGDLAARLGGDEFAVLVECFGSGDGERVAERLVDALEAPFAIAGREIFVHTSVGIAYGRPGQTSADDLLRNADLAMYEAKSAGKRRYARYAPAMQDRIRRRHELVSALERAPRRGEIDVHYQPIVDLCSGRLVAVEALARWARPEVGLVAPAGFIGVADEVGLMAEIGRAVRREACRQTRAWQQLFPEHDGLRVAVNLAPSELHDARLVRDVAEVLEEMSLEPSSLMLEITESGVMQDPTAALRTMHELRELGVSLALDDFGTGHSSLAHLRAFPLDVLKIAQPFVVGVEAGDGHDAAFLDTIVRLGGALNLSVVAEGIETHGQAEAVARLACDLGQGFHFGPPLAPLGVTSFLAAERLPAQVPGFSTAA
jgi:diguanylate cyclase (GGDEF)-like protein